MDELIRLTVNVTGRVRRETLHGRAYLVAPARLIVSDNVLPGSKGPLFYPADEVARSVDMWNGMPLVVNHPTDEAGRYIFARSPKVLSKFGIGQVFNANFNSGNLDAEAWFDEVATRNADAKLSHRNKILPRLLNSEPIELSTGLRTLDVPVVNGRCPKGRAYTHIATNYRPDHLAILPDVKGACNNQDGCGVMVTNAKRCDMCKDKNEPCVKCKAGGCGLTSNSQLRDEYGRFAAAAGEATAKAKASGSKADHFTALAAHHKAATAASKLVGEAQGDAEKYKTDRAGWSAGLGAAQSKVDHHLEQTRHHARKGKEAGGPTINSDAYHRDKLGRFASVAAASEKAHGLSKIAEEAAAGYDKNHASPRVHGMHWEQHKAAQAAHMEAYTAHKELALAAKNAGDFGAFTKHSGLASKHSQAHGRHYYAADDAQRNRDKSFQRLGKNGPGNLTGNKTTINPLTIKGLNVTKDEKVAALVANNSVYAANATGLAALPEGVIDAMLTDSVLAVNQDPGLTVNTDLTTPIDRRLSAEELATFNQAKTLVDEAKKQYVAALTANVAEPHKTVLVNAYTAMDLNALRAEVAKLPVPQVQPTNNNGRQQAPAPQTTTETIVINGVSYSRQVPAQTTINPVQQVTDLLANRGTNFSPAAGSTVTQTVTPTPTNNDGTLENDDMPEPTTNAMFAGASPGLLRHFGKLQVGQS